MVKYDRAACNRFVNDMERLGYEPVHYKGRNHWEGPAVTVPRKKIQEVKDGTNVLLDTSENLGREWIVVHPVIPGKLKGK